MDSGAVDGEREKTMREKLIELLGKTPGIGWSASAREMVTDHLIANGVTFATDNNVGDKMTPTDKDTNVLTNADRIRAMSDEELMRFLFNEVSNNTICSFCVPTMRTKCKCDGHCKNGILEWLKQPAEVEHE